MEDITPGTPAADVLKHGDIVWAINGRDVTGLNLEDVAQVGVV